MRRMISDNQLNSLISGAGKLKIIELDGTMSNATITQEQLDIMFPKDAQGNIYKPDYYIVIADKISATSGGYQYLAFWSSTKIRFNRLGTNGYYTWTIGPTDTKFTQTRTSIEKVSYYQHYVYIKTSDLYIFLQLLDLRDTVYPNISYIDSAIANKQVTCSGYLMQKSAQGPIKGTITSIKLNSTDNKYYFSVNENIDYGFFEANDIVTFTDAVELIH